MLYVCNMYVNIKVICMYIIVICMCNDHVYGYICDYVNVFYLSYRNKTQQIPHKILTMTYYVMSVYNTNTKYTNVVVEQCMIKTITIMALGIYWRLVNDPLCNSCHSVDSLYTYLI
jgi:hypothetical protein